MFYPDLSPVCKENAYSGPSDKSAVYIGWLEPSEAEPTLGETSEDFKKKLVDLCNQVRFIYESHRGFHLCPFCHKAPSSYTYLIPNKLGDKFYYFPKMIDHYVLEHQYKPPSEFIEAVLDFGSQTKKDANILRRLRSLKNDLLKG